MEKRKLMNKQIEFIRLILFDDKDIEGNPDVIQEHPDITMTMKRDSIRAE